MYICISSSFAVVVEIDFIHKKKTRIRFKLTNSHYDNHLWYNRINSLFCSMILFSSFIRSFVRSFVHSFIYYDRSMYDGIDTRVSRFYFESTIHFSMTILQNDMFCYPTESLVNLNSSIEKQYQNRKELKHSTTVRGRTKARFIIYYKWSVFNRICL